MNDTTPMPWGKHRGTPIGEVPFKYLMQFYKKRWINGPVLIWFEKQLAVLEQASIAECEFTGKKPKKYLIPNYEIAPTEERKAYYKPDPADYKKIAALKKAVKYTIKK